MASGAIGRVTARLTYANVVSTIALILAVGGGSFAFAALSKNSVKSKQIASNAVKAPEIAANAVRTGEVAANAITGEKANEATFGQVPSAANANQLGGIDASGFLQSADVQAFGAASTANSTPNDGFASVASKTFTAPRAGLAFVVGSVSAAGTSASVDTLQFRLSVDGNAVTSDIGMNVVSSDQFEGNTGSTTLVFPVAAGNHTVSIDARRGDGSLSISGGAVSILFVPNGSGVSLPF